MSVSPIGGFKNPLVAFSNSQLSADLVGFGNFKTETVPKKQRERSATIGWAKTTMICGVVKVEKWLCLKAFGNTTHPKDYPKLEEVGF